MARLPPPKVLAKTFKQVSLPTASPLVKNVRTNAAHQLYFCEECKVVKAVSEFDLKTVLVVTTEKLSGIPSSEAAFLHCPVCRKDKIFYNLQSPPTPLRPATEKIRAAMKDSLI